MGYGLVCSGHSAIVIDKHEAVAVCNHQLRLSLGSILSIAGVCAVELVTESVIDSFDLELVWGKSWNLGKSQIR